MIKSQRRLSVRRFVAAGALVATVTMVSGCSLFGVTGSGPVNTEVRSVDPFTIIEAGQGLELEVHIGPAQDVQVRAQSNVLPLIATTSEAGTLRITVTGQLAPGTEVMVAIVVPNLDGIVLSGGSNGTVNGLTSSALTATLSGGSVLTAVGLAETATINVSGGSRAQLRQLAVTTMIVDATGGSVVEAQVSAEVRGSASGGARVSVSGDAVLNVEVTGGANVERV